MQRHRDWFAERFKDSRLIVVGGERTAWRRWRARTLAQHLARSRALLAVTAAALASAAGLLLAVTPAPMSVSLSVTEYRIGGTTLHSADGTTYTGSGSLLILPVHGGTRSAATAVVAGRHVVGVCDLAPDGRSETCRFTIDGHTLTARDRFGDTSWMRVYSDGQAVEIPAAPRVPVPFPVGR